MHNPFPTGTHKFSSNKIIDYETNRWFGLGLTRLEDLKTASQSIRTISDNEAAFLAQATKAEKEGRLLNAAIYYHAAQFFVPGDMPSKMHLYDKFYECFYNALPAGSYKKHQVPYQGTFLPVVGLSPENNIDRGTILFHGGFDSVVEEFYPIPDYFRKLGYKVYYFEGPGQGYALRKNNLPLDHDWEKPVKAILDFLKLDDVTIIGTSLGGYWCLRAAAFESRIKRVIAYGLVFDLMALPNSFMKRIVNWFFAKPERMERSIKIKMKFSQYNRWVTDHWAFVTRAKSVGEVPGHMLKMSQEHMHPQNITQDVLLLTGENDEFIPSGVLEKQKQNLCSARSVTARLFTKAENADRHCQIGNVGLAVRTMAGWLSELEKTK